MNRIKRGILIALEGIDGSGKSTLAAQLTHRLTQERFPVCTTKEPGATKLGKQIRPIVQEQTIPLCHKAEYLLFAADRAQHFDEFVLPRLEQKYIVLSDRLADSSLVYQGYGRGLDLNTLKTINAWAMNNRMPDIVFYLRLSQTQAMQRLTSRTHLTAFETEQESFLNQLVTGFDTLYANRKDVIIIDATQSPEEVCDEAYEKLIHWLTDQKVLN